MFRSQALAGFERHPRGGNVQPFRRQYAPCSAILQEADPHEGPHREAIGPAQIRASHVENSGGFALHQSSHAVLLIPLYGTSSLSFNSLPRFRSTLRVPRTAMPYRRDGGHNGLIHMRLSWGF